MKDLKKLLLVFCTFLMGSTCFGQVNTKEAYHQQLVRDFSSIIDYPAELIRNCISTVCLIKIQVDSEKNITKIQLSDSADSLFNVEFKKNKHKLDIKLWGKYLKAEYPNSNCSTYLIPLSYSLLSQMPCPPQSVKIIKLWDYSKFDGEYLQGNIIFLNPIYLQTGSQR